MLEIYLLDLLWTFAFSVYGSYLAIKKWFDLFWIFVAAFLTAVWWSTIREIMLNHIPYYFYDYNYLLVICLWVLFTLLVYNHFDKIKSHYLLVDAIGLVTFAFIGAQKAIQMGLWIFPVVFLATVTAVWWWILRDIILDEKPQVLYQDFYATVAILEWFVFAIFRDFISNLIFVNLVLIFFVLFRIFIIIRWYNLWKPKIEKENLKNEIKSQTI